MMEIRTTDEARKNVDNFSIRLLNLQLDKKRIDVDIKALKDEFKEEGVPVGIVQAVLNLIKADKKRSEAERFEREKIYEWCEDNEEISNKVTELGAKA
jgi:uncharacterized protein (UPF0335 family)